MLRPARLALSLLGLLVGAFPAEAQSPAAQPVGLSLGLRAGYGIPGGSIGALEAGGQSATLSDGVKGMVPFGLDLGYRIIPHLAVGASLQYGFGLANDKEDGCQDCTISDLAFGASAYLHAAPTEKFDPWVGLGLGYEILNISADQSGSLGGGMTSVDLKGFQFVVLQIGADVATGSAISVGPFFGVSAGRYGKMTASGTLGGQTLNLRQSLARTAWHEWITLGVQGKFNL